MSSHSLSFLNSGEVSIVLGVEAKEFNKIFNTNNNQLKSLRLLPFGRTHGACKGFATWCKKFYAPTIWIWPAVWSEWTHLLRSLSCLQAKPKVNILRIYEPFKDAIGLNGTHNDPL